MTEIKLVIPEIHPSLNEWAYKWHYRKRAKEKKRWGEMVHWIARPKKPKEPIEKAEITVIYYFKINRRHDFDNYIPKFILDGLVDVGIIKDDDLKHLNNINIIQKVDRQNPRTEVVIKEVI
ncbi:RusA family crossover junction endodeoxyribonuclease [Dethiothermospora halolimnae]|uniref:RusA family crossover junction endodeoxyribonuclease n=1 Tax=Dethiothermospora halolimnae TaxID=3114390 RepID=UPI003CCC06AF